MKKVYIDFEMNMASERKKRELADADIIAIGAIQYDTKTGKVDEFKSLIKPITNPYIYPHIEELTHITQLELDNAPSYEEVMRKFKQWLGKLSNIEGIYTFGNLDFTCFNNTDKKSSQKYNHPRFINNIRSLFIDIKEKYLSYGIRCMNYVSLKNLLISANIEFEGDAHDPLYDAYNLFILDKVLEKDEKIRNILKIQDIIKQPFTILNEELEDGFEKYKKYFYKSEGKYTEDDISIEILKAIRLYTLSIRDFNIYDIDIIRDIERKLDIIDKLKDINTGYFYLLKNFYLDMTDLLNDLMLYKLNQEEYKEEIDNIINLFEEDLSYEDIYLSENLKVSC